MSDTAKPSSLTPVKPTLEEFLENAIANNVIEGYIMSEAEKEKFRAEMRVKYAAQWEKLTPKPTPSA